MKKIMFLALVFGVAAAMLFSCKRNEGQASQPESSEEIIPVNTSSRVNPGFILRLNGGLWSISEDTGDEADKVAWVESMSLGEKVLTGDIRRATYPNDGRVYEFIEIRRDSGKEGYAFATQVAVGGSLAVVIDDRGNLFRSPKAVDVSGTILSRKTVVVCYPDTESDGFIQISGLDSETQAYIRADTNYIRISSLSRKNSDIQSSILLQTALPLNESNRAEKTRRDALLESAMLDYPDSVFHEEILRLANPNAEFSIQTEVFEMGIILYADNVEVRDLPDNVLGRVVGHMAYDSDVSTAERTTVNSVVNGKSGRWIKVKSPISGWFFATSDMGAFLIGIE
jgi:hypothetical protein